MQSQITWPENKRFAFTVFDDTDWATLQNAAPVYDFLSECGLRTTKSCWPLRGDTAQGSAMGQTCDDADYLRWLLDLQSRGFEIGWHGATWHSSSHQTTLLGLEQFAKSFGHYPHTAANHDKNEESIYWGDRRLGGICAGLYNLVTFCRNHGRFRGHIEGDPHFWGDLCRQRIKYFRNFIFQDINTLQCCPFMPYHDPRRPYVNYWFASSNGATLDSFLQCVCEENQDRLEREGGACIMYTHFANGFVQEGRLSPQFRRLIEPLAGKDGWFVPVHTLLDYLQEVRGRQVISDAQRCALERKWFWEKLRIGTT